MTASAVHQWLALWIARRMTQDGFDVVAFDGPAPQAGTWNHLPQCPEIGGFRPDVLAVRAHDEVAIGEAKTALDLRSSRSRRQLSTFFRLRSLTTGCRVSVYVAVPTSALAFFERILMPALGVRRGEQHIVSLGIPDVLLEVAA